MLRRILRLGLALLLIPAPPARAQEDEEEEKEEAFAYDRNGFYVGIVALLGVNNFKNEYEKDGGQKRNVLHPPVTGRFVVNGNIETRPPFPATGVPFEPPPGTPPLISMNINPVAGGGVKAGYRFAPHLAGEFQFEISQSYEVEVTEHVPETLNSAEPNLPGGDAGRESPRQSIIATNDAIKLRPWVVTWGVKGFATRGRIQPYALLGAGLMKAKIENRQLDDRDKQSDFVLRFGGGFDFYATENAVVNIGASYVLPTGNLQTLLDYFSIEMLGFSYRF